MEGSLPDGEIDGEIVNCGPAARSHPHWPTVRQQGLRRRTGGKAGTQSRSAETGPQTEAQDPRRFPRGIARASLARCSGKRITALLKIAVTNGFQKAMIKLIFMIGGEPAVHEPVLIPSSYRNSYRIRNCSESRAPRPPAARRVRFIPDGTIHWRSRYREWSSSFRRAGAGVC